ncbi:hypothetical protein [Rhizobium rhizogenes]|uniref:hypothetical protein n=1 Tax=Rhizobium rhizogenes TaxID=359 RepID=UPI0015746F63|nr:hypothetical protein [Rhizobium rhizogenes]
MASTREWGASIRELADAIRENPLAQFFAEMSGYGFKLMLWGADIAFLAGTVRKLASAMLLLSGASSFIGALKTHRLCCGACGPGSGGRWLGVWQGGIHGRHFLQPRKVVVARPGRPRHALLQTNPHAAKAAEMGREKYPMPEGGAGLPFGFTDWRHFLLGKGADEGFNFREHVGSISKTGPQCGSMRLL